MHGLGRRKLLVGLSAWLMVGAGATAGTAAGGELAPASRCPDQSAAAAPGPQVDSLRCLINWARRSHGLRPLRSSARLDHAARLRAEAIQRCGDFSHTACGSAFVSVFSAVGYMRPGAAVGENIAWGSGSAGSARATVRAWLASPHHRSTLLGRPWRDGGLALVRAPSLFGATNVQVWVAQFGRR